jgi:osmotically-inducible protein OsmY
MTSTDELIKRDVVNHLAWDDRVDASRVTVQVSNGTVTLIGEVPSYFSKSAAKEDAQDILGVIDVINQLSVAYPSTIAIPTDTEIENNIRMKLGANPDINLLDMDVEVNAGTVVLRGTVETYWKKLYAENLIEPEPGVVFIENHLAVVPTENVIDQEIANDIIRSIEAKANVNAENVDVKVTNGNVMLTGMVSNWSARCSVFESALYTAGVVDVDNQLAVAGLERGY